MKQLKIIYIILIFLLPVLLFGCNGCPRPNWSVNACSDKSEYFAYYNIKEELMSEAEYKAVVPNECLSLYGRLDGGLVVESNCTSKLFKSYILYGAIPYFDYYESECSYRIKVSSFCDKTLFLPHPDGLKFKVSADNINHWYIYSKGSWYRWDVTGLDMRWSDYIDNYTAPVNQYQLNF